MGRVRAAWGSVVSHSSHNSTLINSRRSVSALLSSQSSLGSTAQSGFTCTCQDALSFLIHLPAQTTLHWVPVIHTPISTCKSPAPPCLSVCLVCPSVRLFNLYLNHNKNIFFTKKLRWPWSSYLERLRTGDFLSGSVQVVPGMASEWSPSTVWFKSVYGRKPTIPAMIRIAPHWSYGEVINLASFQSVEQRSADYLKTDQTRCLTSHTKPR